MKKKVLALAMALAMSIALFGCGSTGAASSGSAASGSGSASGSAASSTAAKDVSIILVTMDGLDNHWVNVDKGAQAAADELGITYQWMAPDKKDTALQIEMLNNAIAAQCDGLVVAALIPMPSSRAAKRLVMFGHQVVYVTPTATSTPWLSLPRHYAAPSQATSRFWPVSSRRASLPVIRHRRFLQRNPNLVDRDQGP